jgi:citrate synthase
MYDPVNIDSTINMTRERLWISASDAATALGVSRATLYAYVSRGYVRSQATAGSTRERGYSREDVERLRRRTEERRRPDKAVARSLQWGLPVLESAITLIDGKTLYYRGHDALPLARTRSVEEVASLIWTGQFDTPLAATADSSFESERSFPFAARAQAVLAAASADDPEALDLRPASVARCGWRILHLLTGAAARTSGRAASRPRHLPPVDQQLARAWRLSARETDVLRAAVVLCADHELNVSSFTARCVASAGSSPYAVVIAGLSALQGPQHGGAGARVEAMLDSLRAGAHPGGSRRVSAKLRPATNVRAAVAARLRRGERIEGFGHPLYRDGDPRAALLLDLLRDRFGTSAELRFLLDVAAAATAAIREKPNVDFALAATARVLGLPPESPLMLFAIGRSIGWIGHAIEQYARDELIRPRAKYVGVAPVRP